MASPTVLGSDSQPKPAKASAARLNAIHKFFKIIPLFANHVALNTRGEMPRSHHYSIDSDFNRLLHDGPDSPAEGTRHPRHPQNRESIPKTNRAPGYGGPIQYTQSDLVAWGTLPTFSTRATTFAATTFTARATGTTATAVAT